MNNNYVHHFNYCQWRIHRGAGGWGEYSKRIFINTVHTAIVAYFRLLISFLAENHMHPIW